MTASTAGSVLAATGAGVGFTGSGVVGEGVGTAIPRDRTVGAGVVSARVGLFVGRIVGEGVGAGVGIGVFPDQIVKMRVEKERQGKTEKERQKKGGEVRVLQYNEQYTINIQQ